MKTPTLSKVYYAMLLLIIVIALSDILSKPDPVPSAAPVITGPAPTPKHTSWNLEKGQWEEGFGDRLVVVTKNLNTPVVFGDDYTVDMSVLANTRMIVRPNDLPQGPGCDFGLLVRLAKADFYSGIGHEAPHDDDTTALAEQLRVCSPREVK